MTTVSLGGVVGDHLISQSFTFSLNSICYNEDCLLVLHRNPQPDEVAAG